MKPEIVVPLIIGLFVMLLVVLMDYVEVAQKQTDKINELEKALVTCLNKSGGFKVGNEFFICEATKVGEDTNAKR